MFVVSSWCSEASHFCREFEVKSGVLQQSLTLVTFLMFTGIKLSNKKNYCKYDLYLFLNVCYTCYIEKII